MYLQKLISKKYPRIRIRIHANMSWIRNTAIYLFKAVFWIRITEYFVIQIHFWIGFSISSESGSGSGSGSRFLITKNWRKEIQLIKKCNLLIPKASLRTSKLQPSKENIQRFKWMKFANFFFIFVGHFCPPGSGSGSTTLILIIFLRYWLLISIS